MEKEQNGLEIPFDVLVEGRTPLELLVFIRENISYETWTKAAVARNKDGHSVRPKSPDACRWCVDGWVAKEANRYGLMPPGLMLVLDRAAVHVATHLGLHVPGEEHDIVTMGEFNDSFSFDLVLAVLDVAVEYVRAHGIPSPP